MMENYFARMEARGLSKRDAALNHAQDFIRRKAKDSLSYHEVLIDGVRRFVDVKNRQALNEKRIIAMPGDELKHGGIVSYEENYWLITEVDASNEVYSSGLMLQCNHVLRWLNNDGEIVERHCIVEDGTKYLIGEKTKELITIGDARIAVTVAKDAETEKIMRGRRFLIDDADSSEVLAYQITKPNRMYNVYGGDGIFRYILNEVNSTADDNMDLRIADFYNWKPETDDSVSRDDALSDIVDAAKDEAAEAKDDDKKVWL